MHALIVLAHPEKNSFNAALKDTAVATLQRAGWSVEVSDLYAEGFDPVERPAHYRDRARTDLFAPLVEQRHAWQTDALPGDVRREIDRLERADLVILQFPVWWHAQPAILKGWFDRVFVSGGLYTSRMRYDRGYFRGRRALCSVTVGAPASVLEPGSRGGDPDSLLWPIQYSMHYMGFSVLPPFIAAGMPGHGFGADGDETQRQLARHRDDWARRLETLEDTRPIVFPGWGDWDETGRRLRRGEDSCLNA
jgi:NAD(P)H dehydrogenase (quinone)